MLAHVLHTLIPRTIEHCALGLCGGRGGEIGGRICAVGAKAAAGARRGLAEGDPTSGADGIELGVEGLLFRTRRGSWWSVHASHVLREEIFTVEVVVAHGVFGVRTVADGRYGSGGIEQVDVGFSGSRGLAAVLVGLGLRNALADVAAIDTEAEMLRRDMSLPFVFGAKGGGAAVPVETAGEGAGVRGQGVLVER